MPGTARRDEVGQLARSLDHLRGQALRARALEADAGEARHGQAIAFVGSAGSDLVQEDEIALPFAHLHRDAGKAGELGGERHEFVIMGGEQAAALYIVVDGFKHGPGDGEAVVGGGAAADFIEDDKAAVGGTAEDFYPANCCVVAFRYHT